MLWSIFGKLDKGKEVVRKERKYAWRSSLELYLLGVLLHILTPLAEDLHMIGKLEESKESKEVFRKKRKYAWRSSLELYLLGVLLHILTPLEEDLHDATTSKGRPPWSASWRKSKEVFRKECKYAWRSSLELYLLVVLFHILTLLAEDLYDGSTSRRRSSAYQLQHNAGTCNLVVDAWMWCMFDKIIVCSLWYAFASYIPIFGWGSS